MSSITRHIIHSEYIVDKLRVCTYNKMCISSENHQRILVMITTRPCHSHLHQTYNNRSPQANHLPHRTDTLRHSIFPDFQILFSPQRTALPTPTLTDTKFVRGTCKSCQATTCCTRTADRKVCANLWSRIPVRLVGDKRRSSCWNCSNHWFA